MAFDVSLTTVGVSASVSIVTSYFGALINYSRLRNRHRRMLGLSFLAEIKSLQRRLRRHRQRLEAALETVPPAPPKLVFSSGDTSVFNNGSSSLGLFTTRTAVEVLEYYSAVRALVAEAETLRDEAVAGNAETLRAAIDEHLRVLRLTRRHSRVVVVALRRDIPMTLVETLRFCARRAATVGRLVWRAAVRWANRSAAEVSNPAMPADSGGHTPTAA
jgi:hypothetical protein